MIGKQKRYLRGLAHTLKPLVQLGKAGITENLVKQIDDNLTAHELIKVKLLQVHGPERKELGEQLAEASDATLVQVLGGMVILYRPHPKKPVIKLPSAKETQEN